MSVGIVYSMTSVIPIGYVGENETREIAIDIRPLIRAWPDLAPVLLAKRPGEKTLYPCVTRVENGVLYWRVTLSDTAIPGKGECVIHMIDGEGRVGKSRTMTTLIERSASGEETQEPPEAIKPWIDDVLASIESVKEGYIEIEQGEENAGLVLVVGEDGRVTLRKGGAGGDGVGVESVEQTQESAESGGENIWTLRLTDGTTSRLIVRNGARGAQGERGEQGIRGERGPAGKDGAQGPAGADGPAGEPGKPGDTGPAGEPGKDGIDGVSPVTSFERIDGGYRLTIKDAAGTHSVEIMDGVGVQGPAGPQGIQGPAGERGEQGERGAPFAIAKIYASQDAMNAGYTTDGVAAGGFVLIETGDVNDEENARLYVKGESRYEYVTDLSGAPGIQGPEGKQGPQGPAGNPGAAGADGKDGTSVTIKSVSESGADGGSNVITFSDGKTMTVKNGKTGAQGPTGPTGATGPAGPTGPAGADGKDGAQGPAGPAGPAGSDATVTETNIQAALGYKPASEASVSQLSDKIDGVDILEEVGKTSITHNLCDEVYEWGYLSSSGTELSYSPATYGFRTANYLPVEGGKKVTWNADKTTIGNRTNLGGFVEYNASKTFIRYTESTQNCLNKWDTGKGITLDANTAFVRFFFYVGSASVELSAVKLNLVYVDNIEEIWTGAGDTFNHVPHIKVESAGEFVPMRKIQSPLTGKKIIYDGDSIAESRLTSAYNGGGYAKLIADAVSGTYKNFAKGGARLTTKPSGQTYHSVVDNLTNLPLDGDLYCFEGGINDYWTSGMQLGTFDKTNFTGTVDTSTVCGALETIFRYALNNFVGKPICFVIAHKVQSTAYRPLDNNHTSTFEDYRNAMVGICRKYSIPYYDAFSESGLNGWNVAQNNTYLTSNTNGTADGCHPNEEGYKRYYVPQLIALFERIMPRG